MINNLTSSSPNLITFANTAPYIGNNGQSAGTVRFNTMTQQMEAYDGVAWINISMNANLSLSYGAEETIRWAQDKMKEEAKLEELAKDNEAVKIALKNVKKAQEQLKITAHLAKEIA
jgi:hypothetical protein